MGEGTADADVHQTVIEALAATQPEGVPYDVPPPMLEALDLRFVRYEPSRYLAAAVPALEKYSNAMGLMTGGIVAAAIDLTFGVFASIVAGRPCVTLSQTTHYLRRLDAADDTEYAVEVSLRRKTGGHLFLEGRALNLDRKLVVTASGVLVSYHRKKE